MREKSSQRWRIGRVIPLVLLLTGMADAGFRLVPRRLLWHVEAYEGWTETLMVPHYIRWRGLLEPNLELDEPGRCGNLSFAGNLPWLCSPENWQIRTERWNFPNKSVPRPGETSLLLVGDSLLLYSETGYENDLANLLSRDTGQRVYNAARMRIGPISRGGVLDLAGHLGMRSGMVIYETGDSWLDPDIAPPDPSEESHFFGLIPAKAWLALRYVRYRIGRQDGLQQAAVRWLEPIENDVFLPNPFAGLATIHALRNGMEIATASYSLGPPDRRASALRLWEQEWRLLAAGLRARHLSLMIVILPSKNVVYGPLYAVADPEVRERIAYLTGLETAARRSGVPVMNLTTTLQQEAAEALARGSLVYPRDETHWGFAARALAARRIAQEIRRTE